MAKLNEPVLDRVYEFVSGLADSSKGGQLLDPQTALLANQVLRRLFVAIPLLPVPVVGPAPDGMVGFTWETADHHANVQVFPDRHLEFFHEDLRTRELWGDESAKDVTPALLRRLRWLTGDE